MLLASPLGVEPRQPLSEGGAWGPPRRRGGVPAQTRTEIREVETPCWGPPRQTRGATRGHTGPSRGCNSDPPLGAGAKKVGDQGQSCSNTSYSSTTVSNRLQFHPWARVPRAGDRDRTGLGNVGNVSRHHAASPARVERVPSAALGRQRLEGASAAERYPQFTRAPRRCRTDPRALQVPAVHWKLEGRSHWRVPPPHVLHTKEHLV